VVHLVLAGFLYAACIWTGLTVLRPRPIRVGVPSALRALAWTCFGLVGVTIVAGGFVAGTHAGFDYNTFPLMEGRLVPAGYARLTPLIRNLTENIPAVQFDHRLVATAVFLVGAGLAAYGFAIRPPPAIRAAVGALAFAVLGQYALGVATLLRVVPLPLAAAHQAGAFLVLTASLVLLYVLGRSPAS